MVYSDFTLADLEDTFGVKQKRAKVKSNNGCTFSTIELSFIRIL